MSPSTINAAVVFAYLIGGDAASSIAIDRPNSTVDPTSASSFSIRMRSPGLTCICFPPLSNIAYKENSPSIGAIQQF